MVVIAQFLMYLQSGSVLYGYHYSCVVLPVSWQHSAVVSERERGRGRTMQTGNNDTYSQWYLTMGVAHSSGQ